VRLGVAVVTMSWLMAAPASADSEPKALTQFTHRSWSAKNGLPGPVRALAQTADGYLWLGTEAGLYRFDGVRFTPYESAGEGHLHSPAVMSLLAARDGSLWMGFGSGGVARVFEDRVSHFGPAQGVPAGGVGSLAEDQSGAIWAGGQYGLSRFGDGQWRRVGDDWDYPAPGAQAMGVDRNGTLWVATDGRAFPNSGSRVRNNTILTLAREGKRFSRTGELVGMVRHIAGASDGTVWVAETSSGEVRQLTGPGATGRTVAVEGPSSVEFGTDGSLWIGSYDAGLFRQRDSRHRVLDQLQISGQVNAVLKDREGTLWMGTTGGLDSFSEPKLTPFSTAEGLDPDLRTALAATPDGSVWFSTFSDDVVNRYRSGSFVRMKLAPYSPSDSVRILAVYVNPAGQLWIGGSFKLAREDRGAFSYVDIPDLTEGSMVEALAEDNSGDLWVTLSGTGETGRILRRTAGRWTDVRARAELPPYRARVLLPDASGRMWLGFENGEVAVFEKGSPRVYSVRDGLRSGKVLVIAQDRRGRIWVGGDSGLSLFDGNRFSTLTEENGLPGSSVSGLLEDDDGHFWLAGALGILRVPGEELVRAAQTPGERLHGQGFDAADGLPSLPRQHEPFPTAVRAADGRLWFSTYNGVASIDPRRWPTNVVPPPVVIQRVVADDRDIRPAAGLRFPAGTRRVEIEYAGLSLVAPERVRFRYKLDGYDTEWRGPVSDRSATYTNLPPGIFRFRVVASNNDGIWNERGAVLEFTLAPAFHQTRAFLMLCVVAAGGLLWAGFRWRMGRERSRLQLQFRERLDERTRIARELHDTLLQGFLSASMQLHVATERVPADSAIRSTLERIQELMKKVIDEGRNALRALRSSDVHPEDLEEAFSRVRDEASAGNEIDFRLVGTGHPRPLLATTRDEVYRIGREALLNAFRHSGASHVEVEIEFAPKGLRVAVRDDGRGMDPQLLTSGRDGHYGVIGMQERARRLGARLRMWSREGGGTEVELAVPARVAFEGPPERAWSWLARLYPGKTNRPGDRT